MPQRPEENVRDIRPLNIERRIPDTFSQKPPWGFLNRGASSSREDLGPCVGRRLFKLL